MEALSEDDIDAILRVVERLAEVDASITDRAPELEGQHLFTCFMVF